jgi:hypothetical protein
MRCNKTSSCAAACRDMETGEMQIVYRRESEGYGILVPEMRD